MAQRKFAALAGIKRATEAEQATAAKPADASSPLSEGKGRESWFGSVSPGLRRGRPAGKRSNPSYEPTTLLLRKETKKRASRLLEDIGNRQDLSDLSEQLLSNWIEQQRV